MQNQPGSTSIHNAIAALALGDLKLFEIYQYLGESNECPGPGNWRLVTISALIPCISSGV